MKERTYRPASTYKASYYNFTIPVPEAQAYLLYNSLYNVLLEADWQEGEALAEWAELPQIPQKSLTDFDPDVLELLVQNGFIIETDEDEAEEISARIRQQQQSRWRNGTFNLTINTTNACNMGCPYCFQGDHTKLKGERKFFDEETQDQLMAFLEREIANPITERITALGVTWFGGEPLLRPQVIQNMTRRFLEFCERNDLRYAAEVITNGTRLTPKVWKILQEARIENVQVTIDGPREFHNISRPLLSNNTERNYDLILKNLSQMPRDMPLVIRINVDKRVYQELYRLLDDLQDHGIWPQRANNVTLDLSRKRWYPISLEDPSIYFTEDEFYDVLDNDFRETKIRYFNQWAETQGIQPARRRFQYPDSAPNWFCGTAADPYGFALDDHGYIYRCWEAVNDNVRRIQHLTDPYELDRHEHKLWMDYHKFFKDPVCRECKVLPVCSGACPEEHFNGNRPCQAWKFRLEQRFKDQYLMSLEHPDQIQSLEEVLAEIKAEEEERKQEAEKEKALREAAAAA